MIGLYNSVRFLPHNFFDDKLIIRFGYQSSIELDFRNIETIKTAREQGGTWENKSKETYCALLNIDTPQYEIFLKEPALMKSSYGRKKYVKTIVFRSVEPKKMIEDINFNMKSLSDE